MTDGRYQYDWRGAEPLPDFASRVVSRLEWEGEGDAQTAGQRRASARRVWRASPLALLGLAAILLSGAALGRFSLRESLGSRPPATSDESQPTTKVRREPVGFQLTTPPAPMEPARARPAPPRPVVVSAPPAETPGAAERPPVPIHFPACHCSSSAIVCSCVD